MLQADLKDDRMPWQIVRSWCCGVLGGACGEQRHQRLWSVA